MSTRLLRRVLCGGALALTVGVLGTGTARASSTGCTDSWTNTSGGQWDTASNWSTGQVPGASDSVCITAPGTYTVVLGNDTITVASLTVGAAGSSPTLQIGNGGSGYPNDTVTGALTIAGTGTVSDGWGGTFTAGSLANAGTFETPATSYNSTYAFGAVQNTGTFASTEANTVSIANGGTFDNAGGTISATGGTLAFSSPTAGAGTLELDSAGTVDIASGAGVTIADVAAVHGGSICGGALTIGSGDAGTGGTLAFTTTPGTGPACDSGQTADQVFIANTHSTLSGTIPAAYTVVAGDGGSAYNVTALSGTVTNLGTFEPGYGATVTGTGKNKLVNKGGTILIPSSTYTTAINTSLTNTGTVTVDAPLTVSLTTGQLWTNGTTGKNATINVASGQTLAISSPSGKKATFTQNGAIDSSGTFNVADPIKISGGSICGNPLNLGSGDGGTGGTLTFASKPKAGVACASGTPSEQLFIYNVTATLASNIPTGYTVTIGDGGSSYAHVATKAALTNAGTLAPQFGATLTVNGALTNTGTVTSATSGYTSTIVSPSVTNNGTVSLGQTTLALSGSYTQGSAGTFVDPVSTNGYGVLSVGTTATLAGTANLSGSPAPSSGTQVQIIRDAGTSGTFATVVGPYTLSYGSSGVTATAN